MSEIKRYSVADILCLDEQIDICKYKDVEPIIQRNKELEAEFARPLKSFGESQSDQAMLIRAGWKANAALNARIDELTEELARLREQEPEYYISTEEERDIALNTLAEMFESAEEAEGEDGMLMSVDISLWNEGCEALEVLIGGEDDVDPTIQHNKELEAEIKRLREHVDSLSCGVSREAWHDTAWSLLQSKAIEDSEIMKVNIHTIRTVFNATYDALAGSALTKPKLAQEIPAELVKWVNNDEPNLEMDDSADVALEKIVRNECRAFVKSQLEKMKGQKND